MLGGHLQSLKWRINQFLVCTDSRDSLDPWIPRSSWLQGGTCQHFLCALYKHTKVNQLFEDAEGKSLTSVMNFCSKPNSIKELGRRLNVHEHGSLPSSRGTSENLQFWVCHLPSTCIMILLTDWIFKICNSDAQRRERERERIIWGQGCLLGHVKFSHGWREGPGKGLLNSY